MKRLALLLPLLVVVGACRSPSVTLIPEAELPQDVYGSREPTPIPEEELPRKGIVYLVRGERLVSVPRTLQGVAGSLPEALMLALLQGPRENNTTAIPPDTRLNDLEVRNTIAYVDLSGEFERPGPRRELALRIAQVVYTLTENPSPVAAVRFLIDGVETNVIGEEALASVARPVNRGDYPQFAPPEG
jgi:Sporulation and spore germination